MTVNVAENQSVSKIVRLHRRKAGLSQSELADLAGLGKTVIFDVEHGKESVRWTTLLRIFQVLNISIRFESPMMRSLMESADEER